METKSDPKTIFQKQINAAWLEFSEIAQEEEEGDYSDAMLSMDRTRAEGYAEGLQMAYYIFYGEKYVPTVDIYEQGN
jgi:hypothetical protein